MSEPTNTQGIDRRDFIKVSAVATAGAAVAAGAKAAPAGMKVPGEDGLIHRNERPETMTYRKLGKTNFMSSRLVFGCGAALTGGKAVKLLESSFEQGINFYDVGTDVYYKGAERHLSAFLKRHRDDVWVTSKGMIRPTPDREFGKLMSVAEGKEAAKFWVELMERSLKDLDVEYMDAYYLMGVGDAAIVRSEELYAAFLKAKEQGKVGHYGVSTHKDAANILTAMAETGWYDVAMIAITPAGWYDWDSKSLLQDTDNMKQLQPVLAKAREAGIGLMGMKTARFLAGKEWLGKGDDSAFDSHYDDKLMKSNLSGIQRSYAYVLENGMDVVNADMQSFEHMEANLQVARTSHEYFA